MKKLLILSLIAFFALGSAKVFAQDALAPHAGESYNYWVNTVTPTDKTSGQIATHVGNSYLWYVTKGDLTTSAGSDVTVTAMTETGATYVDASTPVTNMFGVNVTWNPAAINSGDIYYLHIVETDGNSCSNHKVQAISPVNGFTLQYAAIASDGTSLTNDATQCAPDVSVSASGTSITYNYGTGDYEFKLIPSGISAAWQFDYNFTTYTIGSSTGTVTYSFDGGSDNSGAASGTVNVPAGTGYVIVKVHIDNGTANEGTTAQSLVLDLSNISDGTNNVTKVYKADGSTEFTGTIEQSQTINARPATSGIGHD